MSEQPSVVQSLVAVMEDVGAVRKGDRNTQQNFSFRGIDAVVNSVSPALRKHGVIVVPEVIDSVYGTVEVGHGERRREIGHVRVTVAYHFHGPAGDSVTATVIGESMDSGDKASPKAMSVAFRTALLQALALPTDEPDPDAHSYERSQPAAGQPDPLTAAKLAVKSTWEQAFGPFDADKAAEHFAEWSGGEVLAEATPERLLKYAGVLRDTGVDAAAADVDEVTTHPDEAADAAEAQQQELPEGANNV